MPDEYVTRHDCDGKFTQLMDAIGKLENKVEDTNKRLFRDNGNRSHQSIINDHDRILRGLIWAVSVTAAALIVSLVGLLISRIPI